MKKTRSFFGNLETKKNTSSNPFGEWNDRYFKLNKSKRNWQLAFIVSALTSLVCLGIIFKISSQVTVVPYIIEVDKEFGTIRNIGDLRKVNYQPGDKNIMSVLNDFIKKTRGIPLDPVRYGKDIQEQYSFLNDVTQQKLLENIENDNVKQRMKDKESRDINVTSILKIRENTYQLRWIEYNYTKEGSLYLKTNMIGVFTVGFLSEDKMNETILLNNPMGIVIQDLNISKEQF